MPEDLWERAEKYRKHFGGLCRTDCFLLRLHQPQEPCGFCASCTCTKCSYQKTYLYGANEAYRWNGKYIYYCPLGLVLIASPFTLSSGELAGALIVGPLLMGDPEDALFELPVAEMRDQVSLLPQFSTAQVHHLAEIMAAVTACVSGIPHNQFVLEQEKLLNAIYDARALADTEYSASQCLIEAEKQLTELIRDHDKNGAQEWINHLLGNIYFSSNFDLEEIKTRSIELVVILSRAVIDAGANLNEILLCNTNYIKDIEQLGSIEELSTWITAVIHRFINYTFEFTDIKHSNIVYQVIGYIRQNYNKKLSLNEIAQHVYLSRTYLSNLFSEETGQSLFQYINQYRIEKSKLLLRNSSLSLIDIAGQCGFDDQSYFTKVFKKQTGISPKKYRESQYG